LEQAHRVCRAGADTAGEALHQQQRPVTASPASRPSLASVVTATKTKAAMGKLNAAAAAVKSAREQAATEDTGVAQSHPAHPQSRSGSWLAALPTIPEEMPDAPDGCTVHTALAWERSESDQSSANTPVTGTRTDGGHRQRDEGRKFEAPSHREARGRLTARGTVTLKATAGHGGSLRAVCSIENRTLTLSIAQRPPRAESGEEPESQSTSAVMVVQVPLEELAVRLQRGRANMFTISTLHKQRLYDEICCFTDDQGERDEWIAVFRRMGVAIFDFSEASADAARSASSCAVIVPVTAAATMSAHRADNHCFAARRHAWRQDPNFLKAFGMSNPVSCTCEFGRISAVFGK
jgi:hypothetical protein